MNVTIKVDHFDLNKIADSGQCFRWEKIGDRKYRIPAWGRELIADQPDSHTLILDCSQEEYHQVWKEYFDLSQDYEPYFRAIDEKDSFLLKAAETARGVRILRQDLWETIISFLISQNNNIPRIKKCIAALCRTYGKFPDAAQIISGGQELLDTIGLGYRSAYLYHTSMMFEMQKIDEKQLRTMDYEEAKACLMKCKGIGPKVADCVCLFGLHHIEAFPVDTWIRRVIDTQYHGEFPFQRYEGFAGVIQQFIFFYMQKMKIEYPKSC